MDQLLQEQAQIQAQFCQQFNTAKGMVEKVTGFLNTARLILEQALTRMASAHRWQLIQLYRNNDGRVRNLPDHIFAEAEIQTADAEIESAHLNAEFNILTNCVNRLNVQLNDILRAMVAEDIVGVNRVSLHDLCTCRFIRLV